MKLIKPQTSGQNCISNKRTAAWHNLNKVLPTFIEQKLNSTHQNSTCEKLTMTGRIWPTQSWGSSNFPSAAQPSTASSLTESWSAQKNSTN